MGLRNDILQYNTLSMMCILVTGLKWRPQGGTENKQRASVRLYWLSWPSTAYRPPKYPVSACVQSTKVFDALLHTLSTINTQESKLGVRLVLEVLAKLMVWENSSWEFPKDGVWFITRSAPYIRDKTVDTIWVVYISPIGNGSIRLYLLLTHCAQWSFTSNGVWHFTKLIGAHTLKN